MPPETGGMATACRDLRAPNWRWFGFFPHFAVADDPSCSDEIHIFHGCFEMDFIQFVGLTSEAAVHRV